ncbi:MAG: FAD-dependent oxidoreductase, partial [Candidatus Gracilibacteria bacterium]
MAPTVAPETHRNPTLKELKGALSPCYDCANEKGGCTASCPSGLPIADMIRLLLKNGVLGKYAAASLAMNANPIGTGCAEACGDHCDAEKGCRQRLLTLPLQELHAEVAQFFAQNLARFPLEKVKLTDKRVAIVGDGPAALSAALFLAASGVEVTIVSNTPTTPGGLLKNIPRVSAESLEAIQSLLSHFSDRITITNERPDLNGETPYDGVILATGLEYKIPLQPLQEGHKDRCSHAGDHAVQFIREHQVDQNTPLQGQIVAIVGGGKTAVDAALLAQRLGATVTVYYRRDFGSMEGREEILKTGIEIQPLLRPTQSFETGDKKIHLFFEKMKVATPNTRLAPEEKREVVKDEKGLDPGICADMVLWATPGKNPDLSDLRTWAGEKPVIDAGDIADGDHPRTVAGAVGSAQRAVKELAGQLNIELQPIIRPPRVNTSVEFAGKTLTTPFIVAAVPTSDAANLTACRAALSQNGCSGMVIKTVSFDDQHIAMPAGYMVDAGDGRMGNADHISRAGITQAIETLTTLKKEFPGKLIGVSIMSPTIEGWGTLAKQLQNAGADFVECSFSCPQGNMTNDPAQKGQMLGQNPEAACRAARAM